MPTSENLFFWADIGTVVPITTEWRRLPNAIVGNEILRITCVGDLEGVGGWAWMRQVFSTPDGENFCQSRRIYPKHETQLIEIPIPPLFVLGGYIARYIEVRKHYWPARYGYRRDSSWAMNFESGTLLGSDSVNDPELGVIYTEILRVRQELEELQSEFEASMGGEPAP